MSRRILRSLFAAGLLAAIAVVTKPSEASFARAVGTLAKKKAGGGVAGWMSAKLAELSLNAVQAAGGYTFTDYWVALLVTPTAAGSQWGSNLTGGESDNWVFLGAFSLWLAVRAHTALEHPIDRSLTCLTLMRRREHCAAGEA